MNEIVNQLSLFDTNSCTTLPIDKWRPSPSLKSGKEAKNDSVSNQEKTINSNDTESSDFDTESCSKPHRISEAAISCYKPRGEARGGFQYFRFSYREGKRMRHVHIPGGNIHSQNAVAHRNIVRAMIKCGDSVEEILEQIEEWRKES